MARIRVEGLTKTYGKPGTGRPALADLDLAVEEGELLVLVGPSGCGKSTALRLIAGLEEPDRGKISLGDRDLSGVAPQDRDVAMVFQGYALYPHMTARQIMAFPLRMRGVAKPERARRVAEIAELVGLSRLLDRYPGELSGGEQQRVAMGRAMVRSPQAFLFDEPLSNLDAKLRGELRVELVSLVRRLGTTAIYVTHDQAEAMTMGDRVAVLRDGELQQVGAPRDIYERPANVFVAGFLGTPPMNIIELSCRRKQGVATAEGITLHLPAGPLAKRKKLVAGVRPEHLSLAAGPEPAGPEPAGPQVSHIAVEVVSVEPLGAETILHLEAGGTRLRARTAGFDVRRPGDAATVHIAAERVLWFDPDTGERLSADGGEAA